MNKIAVFTVVFPAIEKYFSDFKQSLLKQTSQNYDLVIVNDGCDECLLRGLFSDFNLYILPPAISRAKHREVGIEYAKKRGYEYMVFCDADDYFFNNRIALCVEYLSREGVDIVVNDLDIVNEKGELIQHGYLSNRISEKTNLDASFLYNKNIFGLSNTAINLIQLPEINLPEDLIIVDWFLFSYLLEKGMKSVFIKEPLTYYRQHESNAIGINKMSVETYKKQLRFKIDHYKHLSDSFPIYIQLYDEANKLLLMSDDEIERRIITKKDIKNPLWWEIIN